jgi:Tol biopolymer transport system component
MRKYIYGACAACFLFCTAFTNYVTSGSGLPQGTEVWMFKYYYEAGTYKILSGFNVSNHEGYDSQPSFSENGSYMLWTSERDSGQTEIYRYDLTGKSSTRLTQTGVSEYSPTYMEGGRFISAVVVEPDSTQRLWKYNKVSMKSEVIFPKITGVGYHTWMDNETIFMFQLTTPFSLIMCDTRSQVSRTIATDIGRCMNTYKTNKRKILLYVQIDAEGKKWIKAIDINGQPATEFTPIPCLEGSEDYGVDKRGLLMMASGSKLYSWKVGTDTTWQLAADLTSYNVNSVSRIAFSPDGSHIAVVNNATP